MVDTDTRKVVILVGDPEEGSWDAKYTIDKDKDDLLEKLESKVGQSISYIEKDDKIDHVL